MADTSVALLGIAEQGFECRLSITEGEYLNPLEWKCVSNALLIRMALSQKALLSLLAIYDHHDAYNVSRNILETAITFAWLAIDPDLHIKRWIKKGVGEALKTTNNELPIEIQKEIDGLTNIPDRRQQAVEADEHWFDKSNSPLQNYQSDILPSLRLEDLYVNLYKDFSSMAHPDPQSLEYLSCRKDINSLIFKWPETIHSANPFSIGPLFFGVGLLIAAQNMEELASSSNIIVEILEEYTLFPPPEPPTPTASLRWEELGLNKPISEAIDTEGELWQENADDLGQESTDELPF